MSKPAPLRLGIAGLGTVGVGVVKIVRRHAELLAARGGRPIEIVAVSARTRIAASTSRIMAGKTTRWRSRNAPTSMSSSS